MDAFYASVEQRDNPDLKGKPIIVGGSPEGRGGVVATASYEARKFGVRSAMSSKKARQLCPHGIFVRPRFEVYKEVSRGLRAIFYRYTDLVEPLSLDEAYLDVTEDKLGIGSALDIAAAIKNSVRQELQLTASAGVSVNKFLAKIASDLKKPDGLSFIGPSKVQAFMDALPVEKFHGVGKVTAAKMQSLGLTSGADIKRLTEKELVGHFGKIGKFYYSIVRGTDDRPVQPNRETKSIGAEDTFPADLQDIDDMNTELTRLAELVFERLNKKQLYGKTLTLKIKYGDFQQITRSLSIKETFISVDLIRNTALQLLSKTEPGHKGIRLLGISISNFDQAVNSIRNSTDQLELF